MLPKKLHSSTAIEGLPDNRHVRFHVDDVSDTDACD
jgi:hypothetical protein